MKNRHSNGTQPARLNGASCRFSRPRRKLPMLAVLLLAGCSFAPDYTPPEMPVPPDGYKEVDGWKPTHPCDAAPRGKWWEQFHDARLNALEDQVTNANQNLKVMAARYQEAQALSQAARADYFPTVTGVAQKTRDQLSKNVPNRAPATLFNDNVLQGNFSYEIDVWGRIRNAVAATESQEAASKGDVASAGLSLQAELASDYFSLRGDDAAQVVLDQTVVAYRKALEFTRRRFEGGVSAEADVSQAETQLENAKTQAEDIRLKRAQLEHAIAVLTGNLPSSFTLAPMPLNRQEANLPPIDPGLPSTLLERRPDIASAERLAYAANRQIGVARAAWFPDFSLNAAFGFESQSVGNWLTQPSRFWTLGPQAALTLFDAGRIDALSEEAKAAYDEAAANYRQTVLAAYQDVEDSLASVRQLKKESVSQAAAEVAAERTLAQYNDRYSGGIVTYLDVVVVQNQALQAELASVDILTRRMNAQVMLIKALGGGWNQDGKDALSPGTEK